MQKLLNILKAAALASVVIVSAFVCILLFQASSALKAVQQQGSTVTASAVSLMQQYQQLGNKAEVTVEGATKLVNDSRYTLVEVNRNVLDERKMYEKTLPELAANADGILANVRVDTQDAHALLLEATARTRDLALMEANVSAATADFDRTGTLALAKFADTLDRTNTLLANPAIPATMKNVAGITDTGNHMLFTFDQVETKATHDYLHPSKNPLVRTWKAFYPFLLPAAQIGGAIAR